MINEASISNKENERITNLKYVQEIILHKHPALLDNFLDVILFSIFISIFKIIPWHRSTITPAHADPKQVVFVPRLGWCHGKISKYCKITKIYFPLGNSSISTWQICWGQKVCYYFHRRSLVSVFFCCWRWFSFVKLM